MNDADGDEPSMGWMASYISGRIQFLGVDEVTADAHALEIEEYLRLAIELHRVVDSPWQ